MKLVHPSDANFRQPLCSRVFNKGDVIEGQSMLASPIGLPTAYAERTALRWPKILLVPASLRCEVRSRMTIIIVMIAIGLMQFPIAV
jgi:hypothetical protein